LTIFVFQVREWRYIKGQKYTLLSRKENLTLEGKKSLKTFIGGQQAAQLSLCPQGELWPVVGAMSARTLLRELAREPQAAATQAL
jgi:hypothetical protein